MSGTGWASHEVSRLLDELSLFVRRFVVVSEPQGVALALWVAHSYCVEAAETTPYLHVSAPEKQSGKTRLLEVLSVLVKNPLATANTTEAALFRSIEQRRPTLLMDEIDTVFGPRASGQHEDLRALLNAGYRRGTPVLRCVGEGARQQVHEFETFSAKALAGIGGLPDTLADRSLPIRLKRRARTETIERFRRRLVEEQAAPLRERLERLADDHLDALPCDPLLPEELSDRAQDALEPLLAIAELAGGDWPERARAALVSLRQEGSGEDDSLGVRLLSDCRAVFTEANAEQLPSAELIKRLAAIEEAAWGDFHSSGEIKPRRLATLLKPYGISSRDIRVGERALKDYRAADFADAWVRYLPAAGEHRQAPEPVPGPVIRDIRDIPLPKPVSGLLASATDDVLSRNGNGQIPFNHADVADVADTTPTTGPAPCRYPGHRGFDWVNDAGRRLCGVCHPQPATSSAQSANDATGSRR